MKESRACRRSFAYVFDGRGRGGKTEKKERKTENGKFSFLGRIVKILTIRRRFLCLALFSRA